MAGKVFGMKAKDDYREMALIPYEKKLYNLNNYSSNVVKIDYDLEADSDLCIIDIKKILIGFFKYINANSKVIKSIEIWRTKKGYHFKIFRFGFEMFNLSEVILIKSLLMDDLQHLRSFILTQKDVLFRIRRGVLNVKLVMVLIYENISEVNLNGYR